MGPGKRETLHKMHDFFGQEARHQRTMMWETVKWFTPLLTLLLGFWGKYFLEFLDCVNCDLGYVLIVAALFGFSVSFIASKLIESFYRTNLKYITMFVKVEDELEFDAEQREKRVSYRDDEHIHFEKYLDDRAVTYRSAAQLVEQDAPSSQTMLWKNIKHYVKEWKWPQTGRMYFWMVAVFYLFGIVFFVGMFIALILLILKI